MKELTIEEKAKRYDEALGKAKKELDTCGSQDCDAARQIFRFFPELQESEDEKIKKWIRKGLECKYVVDNIVNNEMADKAFAWLEKQGKQKSADKVEPKFKVGDKIIRKELSDFIHNTHKIIQVDILDKKYRLEGGLVAHFSEENDWELVEPVEQKPADWNAEKKELKKIEQNPTWSDEDDIEISILINALGEFETYGGDFSKQKNWLKSLKERMQ